MRYISHNGPSSEKRITGLTRRLGLSFVLLYHGPMHSTFYGPLIITRTILSISQLTVLLEELSMLDSLFHTTEECSIPLANSSVSEICRYLNDNCNDIRHLYLRYYYCGCVNNPLLSNILLWTFVIISIGILFLLLGLLASDYLVPNLSALSETLKMDEKLAGLTLLAFANGSPDILSTYIAMKNGVTTLAIGELLGSANFALTVVIGVLAIYQPFKVNQNTFIRDLLIFSILFLLSIYMLSDGVITLVESIILCVLYIIFIFINLFLPQNEPQEIKSSIDILVEDSLHNNTPLDLSFDINSNQNIIETQSVGSALSNESNTSLNDYYFAQNVDNLERGRSYKMALVDSLRLAWLWQKKVSNRGNIPTMQRDIEQLDSINENTPLHTSPHSDVNIEINIEDDDELNGNNSGIGNNTLHRINTTYTTQPYTNNIMSDMKKIKDGNGNEFQILYPSKPSYFERESISPTLKSPDSSDLIFPLSSAPLPFPPPPPPPPSRESESTPERVHTPPVVDVKTVLNREGGNNSNFTRKRGISPQGSPLRINTQLLVPPMSYQPSVEAMSPMLMQQTSTASLIPYVEYQKTSNIFVKICPIHIVTGAESVGEKILGSLLLPLSTIINLFIPIPLPNELEGEIYKHEFQLSANLFIFQIAALPVILFGFELTIPVLILIVVLPLISISLRYFTPKIFNLIFHICSSIVGFLSVLKLISITASAIILILQDIAELYQLNESILGLTILSLGNSVGDVVTNLALAGLGRPLTGLHACLGSPLLYLLFGIGACSLVVQLAITKTKTIEFTIDRSLELTAISIMCMLVLYSIIIPLNNWMFKRWMGCIGVAVWFIITLINFILHRYR